MKQVSIPITAKDFEKVAERTDKGQLKQRHDKYGLTFSIWLNGHMVMSSTVDAEGSRHYWSHL